MTLPSVSASSINAFLECPRQWFYTFVQKIPQKELKDFLKDGIELHKDMEDWYNEGKEPKHPSAKLALTLPEVPARGPNVFVEMPKDKNLGIMMAGVPVRGIVDIRVRPPGSDHFIVLDWKSCKNYAFIKTPDELARNPQGIIYLSYGFKEYPETSYGIFRHVYLRKSATGAKAVSTDSLSRSYVGAVYRELEGVVTEMKSAACADKADDVRFNKQACQKFGGCPYLDICSVHKSKVSGSELDFDLDAAVSGKEPKKVTTAWIDTNKVAKDQSSLQVLMAAFKAGKVSAPKKVEPGDIAAAKGAIDTLARIRRPQDPHVSRQFQLVTTPVCSAINPPDAREPYPVKPWSPGVKNE